MDEPRRILEERPPRAIFLAGACVAAAVALGSALWAYLEYAGAARTPLLALALCGVFVGMAFSCLLGFRATFTFRTEEGERPWSPPAEAPLELTAELGLTAPAPRRRFLGLLAAAGTGLFAILLLPLRSLGGWPAMLRRTGWRAGVRVHTPDGRPLRPSDLAPGSATPVVPASGPADANSLAVLVRLRTDEHGAPALRAFSRTCTHSGCAVSIYRSEVAQLVCPCHFAVFDAAAEGQILSGPASRPLPRLPLSVDREGYLVADGNFDRNIGPRWGVGQG